MYHGVLYTVGHTTMMLATVPLQTSTVTEALLTDRTHVRPLLIVYPADVEPEPAAGDEALAALGTGVGQ